MESAMLGWRDAVLVLVALAAIYLVYMLIRLTQLGRHPVAGEAPLDRAVQPVPQEPLIDSSPPPAPLPKPERQAGLVAAAYAAEPEDVRGAGPFATPPAQAYEWDEVRSLFGDPEDLPPSATESAGERRAGGFGEHLAEHLARSDMEMEVQRMRSEMERMRGEMEALRAASRVSPQYADAMEMAQRGLSAQDLADRLDMSLGEAELVHALSRGSLNFEEGEEHGADPHATGTNEFERHRAG